MENSSDTFFTRVTFDKIKLSYFACKLFLHTEGYRIADLGVGPGGPEALLFEVKNECKSKGEEKPAGKVN